jgi:hypothetical protein
MFGGKTKGRRGAAGEVEGEETKAWRRELTSA